MGTVWGNDSENYADGWCGMVGQAPRTSSTSEYQSALDAIDRMLADERAGKPFTPPIRTNEPEAGDCGYEPGSLPPVIRWHPIARAFAAFVISGAIVYAAMYFLPIIANWIRR